MLGLGRRAPREGVQIRQMYPEPWFITNRWWAWMLYRGLLGRPMDGVRWTNSTFWRAASEGEDHWWLRLAGWQRAVLRIAMLWSMLMLTVLTIAWSLGAERWPLQLLLLHLVGAAPVLLLLERRFQKEHGLRLPLRVEELEQLTPEQELELDRSGADVPVSKQWRMVWVREGRRTWREEVVEPVAAAAAAVLDVAWRPGEAERWVEVPRNYMLPGNPVEIMLPRGWAASETRRKALVHAIAPRLGMLEHSQQWLLQGRAPRLLLSAPPAPPVIAHYADYREQLLQLTEQYRPVLGVVSSGELLQAEMVDDSPHIALSAGSGAGKSMLLRAALIAQALHWGWSVIILDWKSESHEWAKGLPGVTYVTDTEGIHDALVRIGEEVEIRKALPKEERAGRPRVMVVCEEWNMTAALLADYWTALRGMAEPDEKRTMPTRSPALLGQQTLEFAGRSFGMFAVLVAQRMSNRVFNGNVDRRENYMIRIMSRYTTQTWKMLLPHIKYMRKPKNLGGWVVAAGEEATYIQALLMSEEEARELATSGVAPAGSPFALGQRVQPDPTGAVQPRTQDVELDLDLTGPNADNPQLDYKPAPMVIRKLSDIQLTLEHLSVTLNMLRKWSKEEPDFPGVRGGDQFSGYLYDVQEVRRWVEKRRAVQAAEKERKG